MEHRNKMLKSFQSTVNEDYRLLDTDNMALNMQSNSGFYRAPVSKSLMLYVGCSHGLTHVPSFAPVFRKIFTGKDSINLLSILTLTASSSESIGFESSKSVIRLVASKLIFPDTRSTVLVCFLVYFFRVLERRSGSLKFSSQLVLSWLLGLSLDILLSPTLPDHWSSILTPGPLSLVLPMFVPYYTTIPLVTGSHMGPFSISTKSLTYILGLQLAASSTNSLVTAGLCLGVGALVHLTSLSSCRLPSLFGSLASSLFGWLASSPPPAPSQPMGATLEIQRTQHAEAVEQQLLRARARQFNVVSTLNELYHLCLVLM